MHHIRFDSLVRAFAVAPSRRTRVGMAIDGSVAWLTRSGDIAAGAARGVGSWPQACLGEARSRRVDHLRRGGIVGVRESVGARPPGACPG